MDAGQMQDLRGIQIADARHGLLIEQRNFDRPATGAELSRQQLGR